MEHLRDEKQLSECQPKIVAKYINNSKNYKAYFEFFCWANIEINLSNTSIASMKLKKLWPNLQIY